ncbi:MAG: TonB-dependent receptor [Bacteroidetes bacterium]|nr:TonB-dependent receptor [Bacteroidota bacterium]
MKAKSFLYGIVCACLLLGYLNAAASGEKIKLTGTVTDKSTGEKIPGVTIYIPDLKTGSITDINGEFRIENLPDKKLIFQFSLIGYKNYITTIDLSTTRSIDVKLETAVKEINAIVVTGSANAVEKNRTPTPITVIQKSLIVENSSSNIIDVLASQPGISQITTGSGISKPVIRGLGYNRVIVINDGIKQEGQQWGDEHGIEIDEYSVDKVEILKGPASLMYGSDAMAGVINMISAPSLAEGKITGELISEFQTNNGLYGYSANSKGNLKGFVWDARFSNKAAHAYKNKYDGYVYNSGYKEYAAQTILGINRSWGFSHLHLSYFNLIPGISEGERDATSGKFIKPVVINDSTIEEVIAGDSDFKSYSSNVPFQKVNHYKIVLNNSMIISQGTLKSVFGYQLNERKEFAEITSPDDYGLYFKLSTFNYELKYHFPEYKKINFTTGLNGMLQNSLNKGTEYLVPAYTLFDGGIFAIAARNFNKIDVSAGIRYDSRKLNGEDLYLDANGISTNENNSTEHRFNSFTTTFSGLTGSAGMAWNFNPNFYTKANISFGFRAPNIAELGANGVHEGTIRYEIGNTQLKAEKSRQVDLSLGFNTDHVSIEIDGFINSIDNFIFLSKLSTSGGTDSLRDGNSVFLYSSGNALLKGGEILIDLHPHPFDWLHFENSLSIVDAQQKDQPDSTKYLPFTPPMKVTSELKFTAKKLSKVISNSYFKIGIDYYFEQDKIYSAFNTETSTPGYNLFHAGIGTDVIIKKKKLLSAYINVTNLGDVAYQSHLSRLKYAPENPVTGQTGIFNMGRNINFKVIVPLEFSKK